MSRRPVMLVTGASGQLGSAVLRRWQDEYDVAAAWYRRPPAVSTEEQEVFDPEEPDQPVDADGAPPYLVQADITDPEGASALVASVLDRLGAIDVMVNAAGSSHWAPLVGDSDLLASFDEQFQVNVLGPAAVVAEAARQCWMQDPEENAARNRNVVNISSTASLHVYPGLGQSLYAAAKAALNTITLHMADELADLQVRCNALVPTTFPGRVPIESVLEGIEVLAHGDVSGRLLVLDDDGWEWR
jgi:NAD(P)-dependent dehydrogenase (short-subunit alcohol dehydrogenase family)